MLRLVFVPLGLMAHQLHWADTYARRPSEVPTSSFPPKKSPAEVFSFNFLAIIPLAWLIGKATEASLGDLWPVSASALSILEPLASPVRMWPPG